MAKQLSKDQKKEVMKDIILKLHEGLSPEAASERFEKEVGTIGSVEIAEIEQGLINEGLSPEEIKKFCNVHALLFKATLEKAPTQDTSPSHPIFLFKLENREIEKIADSIKAQVEKEGGRDFSVLRRELEASILTLKQVETHYERKEQLLFPYLERQGFTGPSKVMWGKDNEIRDLFKKALTQLADVTGSEKLASFREDALNPLLEEVVGMIFKEENILFPTALEKLEAGDWVEILRESDDIGYVFIQKPEETTVLEKHLRDSLLEETLIQDDNITLPTGTISLNELMHLFNTLPVDITFVGKDDTVRYFSASQDRIFSRTKAIIGRKVQNCHPPQSVDVVEKILASFKDGTKDYYDFWLTLQGKFVCIRYFALRDSTNQYLGTLEVTQDVTGIRKLEGEKRLLDERD
ncbi:DUF438 domain-containing protein [Chloroflexota bacterium]